jgi:hypothetical protein
VSPLAYAPANDRREPMTLIVFPCPEAPQEHGSLRRDVVDSGPAAQRLTSGRRPSVVAPALWVALVGAAVVAMAVVS